MKKRVILEMLKQAFLAISPLVFIFYIFCSILGYVAIWGQMNLKFENGIPVDTPLVFIPNTAWGWFWFIGICIFLIICLCLSLMSLYNWYEKTEQMLSKKSNKPQDNERT